MRRNAIIVGIFTLILICTCIYMTLSVESPNEEMPFSLVIGSEERELDLWRDEDGYYAFLPSYVELRDLSFALKTGSCVLLDGKELKDGMSAEEYVHDKEYKLRVGDEESYLTFLRSDGMPTVYIDTYSGSMDTVNADKDNSETAVMTVVGIDGSLNLDADVESISGHGNSTWTDSDKKPYNIRLKSEADILGMGRGKRWILLANSFDRTGVRNTVAYDFSRELGLASPDNRYVTLYLNGEYAGLYQLCERNEVYPGRVEETEECFLVSMEYQSRLEEQGYAHVVTNAGQALRIHYSNVSEELVGALWQSVENAILAEDNIDPTTDKHLFELIDIDSWARKYIIEETFCSVDACFISQYFYWNGDKVVAGPVWDFDTSMGRKGMPALQSPYAMLANRPQARAESMTPWFHQLYKNEEFYARVTELYESEFMPALRTLVNEEIEVISDGIDSAWQMDSLRWHEGEQTDEYLSDLMSYLSRRIEFLNSIWVEGREYHTVTCIPKFSYYSYIAVYDGQTLAELPKMEDTAEFTFVGWYYEGTDEPFDIEKPITEDVTVYALYSESGKGKLDTMAKMVPVASFAVIFAVLLVGELLRNRRRKHEDK